MLHVLGLKICPFARLNFSCSSLPDTKFVKFNFQTIQTFIEIVKKKKKKQEILWTYCSNESADFSLKRNAFGVEIVLFNIRNVSVNNKCVQPQRHKTPQTSIYSYNLSTFNHRNCLNFLRYEICSWRTQVSDNLMYHEDQ